MAIIAFVSPKGSPGVTTTALACTLSWHSRVVLAECDPAGGSLMAGYLGGALDGPRGIGELAVSELRDGRLEQDFWGQLVDLDAPKRQRLLLPGLANPAQAGSLTPLWGRFADFFTRLEHENPGFDVLADCGRLHVANPPWPILRAASAVLVVTSARLPDLSNAAATLEAIGRDLRDNGVPPGTVRLVVVGGGHGKGEISRALGVPVAAHMPIDRQTAQVLSYGGTVRGRRPLMRAAAALEMPIRSMVDRRRARATWSTTAPPIAAMPPIAPMPPVASAPPPAPVPPIPPPPTTPIPSLPTPVPPPPTLTTPVPPAPPPYPSQAGAEQAQPAKPGWLTQTVQQTIGPQQGWHPQTPDQIARHSQTPESAVRYPHTPEAAGRHPHTPESARWYPQAPDPATSTPRAPGQAAADPDAPSQPASHPQGPGQAASHPQPPGQPAPHPQPSGPAVSHPRPPGQAAPHPQGPGPAASHLQVPGREAAEPQAPGAGPGRHSQAPAEPAEPVRYPHVPRQSQTGPHQNAQPAPPPAPPASNGPITEELPRAV